MSDVLSVLSDVLLVLGEGDSSANASDSSDAEKNNKTNNTNEENKHPLNYTTEHT